MSFTLQLDHVSLHVMDLEPSVAFYHEVLGLPEIENKTGRPHIRWFGLGPHMSLHLISGAAEPPDRRPPSTHFAVATGQFDETLARLVEKRVPFGGFAGPDGQAQRRADGARQIYLQDPDGH